MYGNRLKSIRLHKGIKTQKELANISGVSVDTIKSIEQGRKKPGRKSLVKLSKALGVEVDEFLKDEKGSKPLQIKEGTVVYGELADLLDIIQSLPEEKRKATIQIIRAMK